MIEMCFVCILSNADVTVSYDCGVVAGVLGWSTKLFWNGWIKVGANIRTLVKASLGPIHGELC